MIGLVAVRLETDSLLLLRITMIGKSVLGFKLLKLKFFQGGYMLRLYSEFILTGE